MAVTIRKRPSAPVLIGKDADTKAAGIAVRAADTGRVLMLQRSIADEDDPARGKWEFPGGCLEPGETPLQGAVREWQEETGVPLPKGEIAGTWASGPYVGHVYVVPSEQDVPLNLDADDRMVGNPDDPDGDDAEVLAWWPPSDAQASPSLRDEVRGSDWGLIGQSVPGAVFKTIGRGVRRVTIRKRRAYPILVRAHVRGGILTPEVVSALKAYFSSRPDVRACEAAEHGFDPLSDPPKYLAAELAEPEHATLRSVTQLTPDDIATWGKQEDAEHAHDHVAKEQPAASDVHIDTASNVARKRKRSDEPGEAREVDDADTVNISVLKTDDEARVVYGVVLEPDVVDSQGDVVSKQDVELAAHRFLYQGARIGVQHSRLAPETVKPVESYIAPCDFTMGGQVVKAGTWVLATHVPDDGLWDAVKKEGFAAYSVAGTGRRTPL